MRCRAGLRCRGAEFPAVDRCCPNLAAPALKVFQQPPDHASRDAAGKM